MTDQLSCLEICAGGGGQALGLELAGFAHELAVEIEPAASETLRTNRPHWKVHEGDVREIDGRTYRGIDLLAGGVPCPPFSVAGHGLGADDERDLFPEALRLVAEARPAAVMLENVRGLSTSKFKPYRQSVLDRLESLGYRSSWQVIRSSDFGVAQLRPRFILVALRESLFDQFRWPDPLDTAPTVATVLYPHMARDGWRGADAWARNANSIGPTIVGGSKKHGGADLGPTRARAAWLKLGIDGGGIADAGPDRLTPSRHTPRLTLAMAAALQGFPSDWQFSGRKTAAYRQIGNAFPPPAAEAIGLSIVGVLTGNSDIVPRTKQYTAAVARSA